MIFFTILSIFTWTVTVAASPSTTVSTGSCAWFDTAEHNPDDQVLYDIVKQYDIPRNNFGATVVSLLYSTPLNIYNNSDSVFPTNVFSVNSGTVNGNSTMPAPNTAVIYGQLSYDLALENLELVFPPYQEDRFYGFAFYDPFQTTYEILGVVRNTPPGTYLLRPALSSGHYGLSTEDCASIYTGCINSPTYAGRLVNRVEVIDNEDTAYVEGYLHNITLKSVPRSSPRVAALSPLDWDHVSSNPFVNALQVVAMLGSRNPPEDHGVAASLPGLMKCAGVNFDTHTYTPIADVNLTQAVEMWRNITDKYLTLPGSLQDMGNDWKTPNSTIVGSNLNGTALLMRSEYQVLGNLPNAADQVIYAQLLSDISLQDNQSLVLTFNGKPPLESTGFWNLEVYKVVDGEVGGLVENSEGIYSVGSNTNITYPDGTLVYGRETSGPEDDAKPFQILFQNLNNPPPSNWSHNWMPTPSKGQPFRIPLRLYAEVEVSILNSTYTFPTYSIEGLK